MSREHINPMQWNQAMGVARQVSARIFRDGGSAADALAAFGVTATEQDTDWSRAVETIAETLCVHGHGRVGQKRAA
jgi:hypothetical protein